MISSELRKAFLLGCERCGLKRGDDPVVLGLSGGCDSTVLGHLLVEEGFNVIGVHVNYGLRAEAGADEQFVRNWSAHHGVALRVVFPNEPPPATGVQAWARDIRYGAFRKVARESGADSIVVAHHADDQLETILMNLERGSGAAGLIGMRPRRAVAPGDACGVARPLLDISRADIEELARAQGWNWVEDASNQTDDYTRNALRMELRTLSHEELEAFRSAAFALADRLASMQRVILAGLVKLETQDGGRLPDEQLKEWPPWLQRWIMAEWLHQQAPSLPRRRSLVEEVLALRHSQAGRRAVFGSTTVWREREGWRMSAGDARADSTRAVTISIPELGEAIQYPFGAGLLELTRVDRAEADEILGQVEWMPDRSVLLVDISSISGALYLRPWKDGDRFQPLGMEGTKKVKSLLTDRKAPISTRSEVPVLIDNNGILCVLGHGQDERTRITDVTTDVLRLRWSAANVESVNVGSERSGMVES